MNESRASGLCVASEGRGCASVTARVFAAAGLSALSLLSACVTGESTFQTVQTESFAGPVSDGEVEHEVPVSAALASLPKSLPVTLGMTRGQQRLQVDESLEVLSIRSRLRVDSWVLPSTGDWLRVEVEALSAIPEDPEGTICVHPVTRLALERVQHLLRERGTTDPAAVNEANRQATEELLQSLPFLLVEGSGGQFDRACYNGGDTPLNRAMVALTIALTPLMIEAGDYGDWWAEAGAVFAETGALDPVFVETLRLTLASLDLDEVHRRLDEQGWIFEGAPDFRAVLDLNLDGLLDQEQAALCGNGRLDEGEVVDVGASCTKLDCSPDFCSFGLDDVSVCPQLDAVPFPSEGNPIAWAISLSHEAGRALVVRKDTVFFQLLSGRLQQIVSLADTEVLDVVELGEAGARKQGLLHVGDRSQPEVRIWEAGSGVLSSLSLFEEEPPEGTLRCASSIPLKEDALGVILAIWEAGESGTQTLVQLNLRRGEEQLEVRRRHQLLFPEGNGSCLRMMGTENHVLVHQDSGQVFMVSPERDPLFQTLRLTELTSYRDAWPVASATSGISWARTSDGALVAMEYEESQFGVPVQVCLELDDRIALTRVQQHDPIIWALASHGSTGTLSFGEFPVVRGTPRSLFETEVRAFQLVEGSRELLIQDSDGNWQLLSF